MESNELIREMRKAPRYAIDARAKICYSKDGFLQRVNVKTVDIGINGVAITTPLALPEGENVEVEVTLPGTRVTLRVKGVIRSRKGMRYGVEFLSTTDVQKDDITRFGNGRNTPTSSVGHGFSALPAAN